MSTAKMCRKWTVLSAFFLHIKVIFKEFSASKRAYKIYILNLCGKLHNILYQHIYVRCEKYMKSKGIFSMILFVNVKGKKIAVADEYMYLLQMYFSSFVVNSRLEKIHSFISILEHFFPTWIFKEIKTRSLSAC